MSFGGFFGQSPFGGSFLPSTGTPTVGRVVNLILHLDANVAATGSATFNRDAFVALRNTDALPSNTSTDLTAIHFERSP